ncbi:thermonuclease family protein [Mesorhizobium sp. CAU 1732]|uniref:thermonuclease family protein n=1 Tax=Mesorhizobium sp. CAU 1732 TaxID=3140358 RepID=UPI003260D6E2
MVVAAALWLAHLTGAVWAQQLPETVTGFAQVYDGVTFDLIESGSRYRTVTRVRLESVEACEIRQKAKLAGFDWPCGVVAAAWLVSSTMSRPVECRPTRILKGGGYWAQCFVENRDIGAEGIRVGMYVLAAPAGEVALPRYSELEENARQDREGLWSSEFMMPADWRRANGSYNPLAPSR